MLNQPNHTQALLRMGDSTLILSHRLSEWCGHGPILEQDIALTNIALDLIGQSRMWLSLAGQQMNPEQSEDDLAFKRDVGGFHNALLTELPNEDFGYTIVRQFLFDVWHFHVLDWCCKHTSNSDIRAIAQKGIKEVAYHKRFSSEWMIRLGDGTEESHQRMQNALNARWNYRGELTTPDLIDGDSSKAGYFPDLATLKPKIEAEYQQIISRSTLSIPESTWAHQGGKSAKQHTEHLGFILTDMQYVQRAYPGLNW